MVGGNAACGKVIKHLAKDTPRPTWIRRCDGTSARHPDDAHPAQRGLVEAAVAVRRPDRCEAHAPVERPELSVLVDEEVTENMRCPEVRHSETKSRSHQSDTHSLLAHIGDGQQVTELDQRAARRTRE